MFDGFVLTVGTKRQLRALCGLLQDYTVSLPVDVVVESNVMAVVIVVRLLRLNLTVASSHYNMAFMQKHLEHSVLHTQQP